MILMLLYMLLANFGQDYNVDIISFHNYILKPTNFTIDRDSTKIHGITQSIAKRKGINFRDFLDDLEKS